MCIQDLKFAAIRPLVLFSCSNVISRIRPSWRRECQQKTREWIQPLSNGRRRTAFSFSLGLLPELSWHSSIRIPSTQPEEPFLRCNLSLSFCSFFFHFPPPFLLFSCVRFDFLPQFVEFFRFCVTCCCLWFAYVMGWESVQEGETQTRETSNWQWGSEMGGTRRFSPFVSFIGSFKMWLSEFSAAPNS